MQRIPGVWPALVIAGVVLSGTVQAQATNGQLPPELLACAEEADVGRRLECFDRETAKLSETPEAAIEETPEPEVTQAPGPEPAESRSTTNSPGEDYGLDEPEPGNISAVVTDITHRPYGEFVVLLDNGQIWEQKHRDNRFRIDVGDQVTISEGLMSGFRLSAGGRNNSVQVKRLK